MRYEKIVPLKQCAWLSFRRKWVGTSLLWLWLLINTSQSVPLPSVALRYVKHYMSRSCSVDSTASIIVDVSFSSHRAHLTVAARFSTCMTSCLQEICRQLSVCSAVPILQCSSIISFKVCTVAILVTDKEP